MYAQALKASLRDQHHAEDPQLRREYLKLFTLASKIENVWFAPLRWSSTHRACMSGDSLCTF